MAKIGFHIDGKANTALRDIAATRTLATGEQVTKSDIAREAVTCYLAAHNDGEGIDAILADYGTDQETYDGAKARLLALMCKEGLAMLGGWVND